MVIRWLAMSAAVLGGAVIAGTGSPPVEQQPVEFIAFRADESRVTAVIKVLDDASARRPESALSGPPVARYGFPYFEAPAALSAQVPARLESARWVLHAGPGRVFEAVAEKVVGGHPACQDAAAVLLKVVPTQAEAFGAIRERYFVASALATTDSRGGRVDSKVGALPTPSWTGPERQSLESLLDGVRSREWPKIRDASESEVARMAASDVSYHRTWAAGRRAMSEAVSQGRVRLTYDVQAFRLDPDGSPTYFVRAEWRAGSRQAFVAALWLRGGSLEVVDLDIRASSWLRMFEFQGVIGLEQLGLVLNVLDRDADGWGEIIFAQGGYESMTIELREYSPTGFRPAGVSYSFGC